MSKRSLPAILSFYLVTCSLAGLLSCGGSTTSAPSTGESTKPAEPPKPPAADLVLPPDIPIESTANFTSTKSGKTYRIDVVKDDREEALRALPAGSRDVPPGPMAHALGSDAYTGTARKAAKLSIVNAPVEPFADLPVMVATLPAHNLMVNHNPPIKTTATSNRVAEEKRNVKLTAFLYAASREDDNDFHLIVGRAPGAAPPMYFTVELSGLPPANSTAFARLKAARDAFKAFFGGNVPGSSYSFFSPPIPVEVEGSLFFDMSHATGNRPGPQSLRPKMPVVWEIHPISKLVFEP